MAAKFAKLPTDVRELCDKSIFHNFRQSTLNEVRLFRARNKFLRFLHSERTDTLSYMPRCRSIVVTSSRSVLAKNKRLASSRTFMVRVFISSSGSTEPSKTSWRTPSDYMLVSSHWHLVSSFGIMSEPANKKLAKKHTRICRTSATVWNTHMFAVFLHHHGRVQMSTKTDPCPPSDDGRASALCECHRRFMVGNTAMQCSGAIEKAGEDSRGGTEAVVFIVASSFFRPIAATSSLRHFVTSPLRHFATSSLRHFVTSPLRHKNNERKRTNERTNAANEGTKKRRNEDNAERTQKPSDRQCS